MADWKNLDHFAETTRRAALGVSLGGIAAALMRPVSALAASHESGNRYSRKGYVNVNHGQMHYRTAGSGPPVILVHGSPSSSRTYIDLMGRLSDQFTVIALDTPGYGNSTPLMPGGQPEITDFARVLAETVTALGLERSVLFGSHTGAKITLQYAVDHPDRVAALVMDGLSIPPGPIDYVWNKNYLTPFTINEDGSFIAYEWTRGKDFGRNFPWYDKSPATRSNTTDPDAQTMHNARIDIFSAGPHYSAGYGAAMRYRGIPVLRQLSVPTVLMAIEPDPLYVHLDYVPGDVPDVLSIERLTADRDAWRARLRALFGEYGSALGDANFTPPDPLLDPKPGDAITAGYVVQEHGHVHVRRVGPINGEGHRPLLILPDVPGGTGPYDLLMRTLAFDRPVFIIDLPGTGDSDPLEKGDSGNAVVDMVADVIDRLGLEQPNVLAENVSTSLAIALAARHPDKVHSLILDGVILADRRGRNELRDNYTPDLKPMRGGGHLSELWHMFRDAEFKWPWYDRSREAIRWVNPNLDGNRFYHRLVDTMKQLDHYGDTARAAFSLDAAALLEDVHQPVLAFHRERDPLYQWGKLAARTAANGKVIDRPESVITFAQSVQLFLDSQV